MTVLWNVQSISNFVQTNLCFFIVVKVFICFRIISKRLDRILSLIHPNEFSSSLDSKIRSKSDSTSMLCISSMRVRPWLDNCCCWFLSNAFLHALFSHDAVFDLNAMFTSIACFLFFWGFVSSLISCDLILSLSLGLEFSWVKRLKQNA